jgi:hypothetical protein
MAEKEILKAATWAFEFSFHQRAHCIASRMLDDYLENPGRDKSSPPAPNPENPAETVALTLVEFSLSSERKQTLPTRTAEQQMDEEKKPVINYEKAEASSLQNRLGELDQASMEKLAGYTDAERNPLSLDLFHNEILTPIEASRAESIVAAIQNAKETLVESVRKAKSEKNLKEKDNAKKRVVLLTRHIRVLEAHKTKFPTDYYKAENAKGDVLGSLCSVFSIPAKKMDGTLIKAHDKRLAIREELGTKSPRTIFDDALEDLKQQLYNGKRDEKAKKGTRGDVSATKKKKDNAKKRVVWLTKHIRVLEAHKTKIPTSYWKAENAKGDVLGSLCSVFSIPAKKEDGTTNKADDNRLAVREKLGAESPRMVFDDALEDLKQQLVSEMITGI